MVALMETTQQPGLSVWVQDLPAEPLLDPADGQSPVHPLVEQSQNLAIQPVDLGTQPGQFFLKCHLVQRTIFSKRRLIPWGKVPRGDIPIKASPATLSAALITALITALIVIRSHGSIRPRWLPC